jgi:hypothetical protein
VFEEIVYDLLFGVLIETSDIEGDESELLPVRFHFREISFDSRSVSIGECVPSVLSIGCSTPTGPLVFVSGPLTPRCYLLFRILGGSSPTIIMGFLLGLLFLMHQLLSFFLVVFFLRLTGSSWQFRYSCFRSPLLLLCCPTTSLSRFVDSFSGVFHGCPILFGPVNPFFDSRMLVGLAWVSR